MADDRANGRRRPRTGRTQSDWDSTGGAASHSTPPPSCSPSSERLLEPDTRRRDRGIAAVDANLVEAVLAEHPGLSAEQGCARPTADRLGRRTRGGRGKGRERQDLRARGGPFGMAAGRASTSPGWRWRQGRRPSCRVRPACRRTPTPSLVARLERGERVLSERSVLVVDEAGMLGTRALARVAELAGEADAKVVLVGDHRQLPEIEAGGAFAGLVGNPHVATLSTNRRQEAPLGTSRPRRAAVRGRRRRARRLRPARPAAPPGDRFGGRRGASGGLDRSARGRAGHHARGQPGRGRRAQRPGAEPNCATDGLLGPDVVVAGGRGFALGDQVLCLRNDRALGVRNGTRGTLLEVSGPTVTIATDDGERRLPLRYLEEGWLTHSYATTIHKAQGATFDRAFVLATDTLYREAGYVALSRARTRTDLYVVEGAFGLGRETTRGAAGPARRAPPGVVGIAGEAAGLELSARAPIDWEPERVLERESSGGPGLESVKIPATNRKGSSRVPASGAVARRRSSRSRDHTRRNSFRGVAAGQPDLAGSAARGMARGRRAPRPLGQPRSRPCSCSARRDRARPRPSSFPTCGRHREPSCRPRPSPTCCAPRWPRGCRSGPATSSTRPDRRRYRRKQTNCAGHPSSGARHRTGRWTMARTLVQAARPQAGDPSRVAALDRPGRGTAGAALLRGGGRREDDRGRVPVGALARRPRARGDPLRAWGPDRQGLALIGLADRGAGALGDLLHGGRAAVRLPEPGGARAGDTAQLRPAPVRRLAGHALHLRPRARAGAPRSPRRRPARPDPRPPATCAVAHIPTRLRRCSCSTRWPTSHPSPGFRSWPRRAVAREW